MGSSRLSNGGPKPARRERAHRLHQPVDVDWLGEVLLEPGGERAPPILLARERGQRDGRHLRVARSPAASPGALPLSSAVGARATTVSSSMDRRGRDTWKVAPFPLPSLAARTVPPCDSTMCRTIARPSPRPP